MAGLSWFELDIDFHDHPKTVALQVELRNPTAEAYVSRIWAYCYHQAIDRLEGPAAVATLEQAAKWKGKTGRLVSALVKVGFLDPEGEAFVVHGVGERLEPHKKAKKNAAQRQRRRREKLSGERPDAENVTRDVTGDGAVTFAECTRSTETETGTETTSEITIVSDPPPFSAPLRAARLGVGHPAFEAVQHWTQDVWPRTSTVACPDVTLPQAQSLAVLCGRHSPPVVMAAMDRAAADPFWANKLDLDTFVSKFGRFLHDTAPPTKPKVTAEASERSAFKKGEAVL